MGGTRLHNRAIIRISPTDPAENANEFLQGLVTNDVSGELPVYAGLLTPQGKALFDFLVWRDGQHMLIDCELERADELAKRLSLYRLRRKLTIEVDGSLAAHWSLDAALGHYDPRLAQLGKRWIAPAEAGETGADDAWHRHRLSLGVAEGHGELGDILWLETNAAELNGVSFSKGCYIGQENTARMNWRQKINRRLLVVPLEKSDEKRRKFAHEDLGIAIDHLRVADIDPDLLPDWLAQAG